ncbi:CsgE family curli-type amyloid fiber assembly protein [Hymenobacter fodinae]|nr:CsgE family curli-type amyloid fiber assembly protein [Hymenobacter fodinae]
MLLCLGSFMLLVQSAMAQGQRRIPVRENQQEQQKQQQAPVRESKAAPLPAKKLEEALRLLLQATSDSAQAPRQQRAMEIDGLIVDQTISKVGHDFYDLFYTQFEAPTGTDEYVVTLVEKPSRGTATLITVSVNENDLLEMPLQPKADYIEAAVADAIGVVLAYLQEASSVSRQLEKGAKQPLEIF